MSRRRRKLDIQLFPFLSVLLCVMGALVLLLVVLDHKARQSRAAEARETASRRAEQRQRERDFATQARLQELERRLAALRASLKQQRAIASSLQGQIAQAAGELATRQQTARTNSDLAAQVEVQLAASRTAMARANEELRLAVAEQAAQQRQLPPESALNQLRIQVETLEQALSQARAAAMRQAERPLYSLVPYQGRLGASRKPIYIECVGNRVVFQPDGHSLSMDELKEGAAFKDEVVKRAGAMGGAERPYVLLIIRPSGLMSYYVAPAALRGTDIEFGYELVDEKAGLDFVTPPDALPPSLVQAARPAWPQGTGRQGNTQVIASTKPVINGMNEGAHSRQGTNSGASVTLLPPDAARKPIASTSANGQEHKPQRPEAKPHEPRSQDPNDPLQSPTLEPKPSVRPSVIRNEPREWDIVVDCRQEGVVVRPGDVTLRHARLTAPENPLKLLVEHLIAERRRRQPDVQPQLKLIVRPDGLRGYYLAAQALGPLKLPTRIDTADEASDRPQTSGGRDERGP
jgi:hypothetical protein